MIERLVYVITFPNGERIRTTSYQEMLKIKAENDDNVEVKTIYEVEER